MGDVCVGVPSEPLCSDTFCTENVSCTNVVQVVDQAALEAAAGSASAGDCLALQPGNYGRVVISGGVHLLGKGADHVALDYVEVSGGTGTVIRGVTVGADGIKLDAAASVTITSVRVSAETLDGVDANAGSSVSVVDSEIHGAARYAISAFDVTQVDVERSVLNGAQGPGMWAQCTGGCDCQTTVSVNISDSVIRDTKIVGLSFVGVDAVLRNVEISGNTVDNHFNPGGGMSVSQCSSVDAVGLSVLDNSNFGVLIDDSTVSFGEQGSTTIEVMRNLRGIWVQNIGASSQQSVTLQGIDVGENTGVGVGIDGESTNVTVRDGTVRDTTLIDLPVLVGGVSASSEEIGDGVNWFALSQVTLESLTVSNSARSSVLIDGDVGAGSTIRSVTLASGDDSKGILQQNFVNGGVQPSVQAAPSVTTSAEEEFAIAQPPAIPPGI
ncbi:MAG: right-handed parallel beta-helix repeat-containing protein [Deltaproteobacteria bacterium]|nr:right-handed parallel beta-helix repeat-containing protein [Deltaproteobacteria bacterium]